MECIIPEEIYRSGVENTKQSEETKVLPFKEILRKSSVWMELESEILMSPFPFKDSLAFQYNLI